MIIIRSYVLAETATVVSSNQPGVVAVSQGYGVLPPGAWLNAVTVKPNLDPVPLQVLAKPINLFLFFSDVRDKDVAWLVVVHCSKPVAEGVLF